MGAVLIDRGPDAATKFVLRMMYAELEGALAQGVPKDPSRSCRSWCRRWADAAPVPVGSLGTGPNMPSGFDVEVIVGGQVVGRGEGGRKADAEKQAAQAAFRLLDDSGTT